MTRKHQQIDDARAGCTGRLRAGLMLLGLLLAGSPLVVGAPASAVNGAAKRHGIAMHGEPALPPGFTHLPYADPAAPKGGRIVLGVQATFDSLNPYIVRGNVPFYVNGYVVQSLMARSQDEPFTVYAQVAESVEMPDDRGSITFHLDPRARFSDNAPVTAEDVLFTFEMLRDRGKPNYRGALRKAKAQLLGERTIRFDLTESGDREMPLVLATLPVLQKASIDPARFEETTLEPLRGSGPYLVTVVKPGQSMTLTRNPAYWGAELPTSRGLYNFDEIRVDFYRDANTMFEAFKAGLIDLRPENDPTRWVTGYDIPAARDGRLVKEAYATGAPKPTPAFVLNARRAPFADARVREAMNVLFDFEWINQNLYFGAYARTGSFFEGSDLSARGRPASEREREWLSAFPGAVREDVLAGSWSPPSTDGSGRDRDQARRALDLLAGAGFKLAGDTMRHEASGAALTFELLVPSRAQERLALVYAASLKRIGVEARVRLVDDIQYWKRLQTFDFDASVFTWSATASPGNEQYGRWSSAAAERQGSLNYAGVRSPAADAMIERMLSAAGREEYVDAVRALDRVLLSGAYVVPLFHLKEQWFARASTLRRPDHVPLLGLAPEALWRAEP